MKKLIGRELEILTFILRGARPRGKPLSKRAEKKRRTADPHRPGEPPKAS